MQQVKKMTRKEIESFLLSQEWVPGVTLDETSFEKSFAEIGLDSLDLLNVIVEVEEELGIDIAINDDDNLDTLNDVVNKILTLLDERVG